MDSTANNDGKEASKQHRMETFPITFLLAKRCYGRLENRLRGAFENDVDHQLSAHPDPDFVFATIFQKKNFQHRSARCNRFSRCKFLWRISCLGSSCPWTDEDTKKLYQRWLSCSRSAFRAFLFNSQRARFKNLITTSLGLLRIFWLFFEVAASKKWNLI